MKALSVQVEYFAEISGPETPFGCCRHPGLEVTLQAGDPVSWGLQHLWSDKRAGASKDGGKAQR